jgi:uncharacterized protein (DUF1800 family)
MVMSELDAAWAAYVPSKAQPWNLRRVVHLHRRAGFAATWQELQRDLVDGPGPSVDRLLKGKARMSGVAEEFPKIADLLARSAHDPCRMKAWWIYRMYWGPDPLGERLTLMWHDHFATSNSKVGDLSAMRRQNEIFRQHARGPFADLLKAVVHDPALLIWLDAPVNRKGQPNENLGRELMELFTLGVGAYTETDVKEAARALTGWTVENGAFRCSVFGHDDGEKTLLGQKGRWHGDDLVRILLEQPATSRRLAWRLCDLFFGENALPPSSIDSLAAGLAEHRLEIAWAVETVLRSRTFFADANLGNRVLGPVEFVVGLPRALERFETPPSTLLLAEWAARIGQDLFYPPNVGGWPSGRGWLGTQAIIGRANFAAALVEGKLTGPPRHLDGIALAEGHQRGKDLHDLLTFFAELFTGIPLEPSWRERLIMALGPRAERDPESVARGIALLMASPEVQLA